MHAYMHTESKQIFHWMQLPDVAGNVVKRVLLALKMACLQQRVLRRLHLFLFFGLYSF